jgi:hypothetical protein
VSSPGARSRGRRPGIRESERETPLWLVGRVACYSLLGDVKDSEPSSTKAFSFRELISVIITVLITKSLEHVIIMRYAVTCSLLSSLPPATSWDLYINCH